MRKEFTMTDKAYTVVSTEDLEKHPCTATIGKMLLLNDTFDEDINWADPKT